MKKERYSVYTIEDLREAVKNSFCWSDVCRQVGVSICTFNFKRMQRLCEENNIDFSHYNVKQTFRRNKTNWTAETLFVENCPIHRGTLRPVLIRLGFYSGQCDECGISDVWNGKPLTIEIDHINGISTDNRRQNLRWLCPNCHSQTSTYRRRASKTE